MSWVFIYFLYSCFYTLYIELLRFLDFTQQVFFFLDIGQSSFFPKKGKTESRLSLWKESWNRNGKGFLAPSHWQEASSARGQHWRSFASFTSFAGNKKVLPSSVPFLFFLSFLPEKPLYSGFIRKFVFLRERSQKLLYSLLEFKMIILKIEFFPV